jgi:hypothetical protein
MQGVPNGAGKAFSKPHNGNMGVCHKQEAYCKTQAQEGTSPSQTSQATQAVKHLRDKEEVAARKDEALKKRAVFDAVQATLRTGQVLALKCIRETNQSTIIIMPTGSGKTRLMWNYKEPGKCHVVCAPFRYLVQQLLHLLKEHGKAVEFPFVDADGSVYGILSSADFIVMPFEMVPSAADLLSSLRGIDRLGPMWIDEVSNVENEYVVWHNVVCHIWVNITCLSSQCCRV